MLKKAFSVWVLMALLMVTLPSVVAYYSARSRFLGGYPVNVPTSRSETQIATNFSIIVLPDTQFYSANYPDIFDNQTQWIADNAKSMNIVFVTHEGDIVNDYSSISQWNNANDSISRLDVGNLSYGVLPGNHDGSPGNLANYNEYFNYSRFNGRSWYGGAYQNDNSNNFELFRGGQDDYLIFHFQYQPSDQVLAWANSTLQNFPNTRVIVTTHSYLNVDGTRTDIGQRIWDSLIAPHADRIFLVLCGHNHAEAERQDTVNGHTVYQLLADYQDRVNGGNGWLRILQFCPGNDKICVRTYSPYLDSYENDSDSQFTLSYDMTGAKIIVVPDDYSTIQEAINAASDGDTVFVKSGTYYENYVINQGRYEYLVIAKNNLKIIGENRETTIIHSTSNGSSTLIKLVSGVSGVVIKGFTFEFPEGGWNNWPILGVGITNCTIEENIIAGSTHGVYLVYYSANNTIKGNTISKVGDTGIYLDNSGGGNKICENTIESNGWYAVQIQGSLQQGPDSLYHNNFINAPHLVLVYDPSNVVHDVWDNGYPSGGNYWSDYSGNDTYSGPYQNVTGSDGIGDAQYAIDANNFDHYPLMNPWTPPDAAALSISSSRTIVGQGSSTNVTVSVENQGSKIEELNATFYANETFIGYQSFMLTSNNSIIFSSDWDLGSLAKGNYSLSICIAPLEGETDLSDNSVNGSWVFITISGDLNGDKTVDIYDAIILSNLFGFDRYRPLWNPNVDLKDDGFIDIYDAIMLATNFGKSWT